MIFHNRFLEYIFRIAALGSALLTVAVLLMMLYLGWPLLADGQLVKLLGSEYNPVEEVFGIYPMLIGSMSISILALCFSLPLSLGTAFVSTVLAPKSIRKIFLAMVRFMAGIPTVIYGFVAIFLLVPFMREQITGGSGLNILTASLVLALLIAPTMIIFFVNGLRGVPKRYCLAYDALGCKPAQKLIYLLIPQAWPAIIAGIVMGFGRAMGDTLISLMIAGNSLAVPQLPTDSGRTLTAHIALVIASDFNSLEFKTIFACGLMLYVFTIIVVALLRILSSSKGWR